VFSNNVCVYSHFISCGAFFLLLSAWVIILFLLFYSGIRLSYLTDLLSLRLVGAVGARIYVSSSYSQRVSHLVSIGIYTWTIEIDGIFAVAVKLRCSRSKSTLDNDYVLQSSDVQLTRAQTGIYFLYNIFKVMAKLAGRHLFCQQWRRKHEAPLAGGSVSMPPSYWG